MSGNLFRPDLFSRSTPAFEPVAEDCYAEIVSVISTHYSNLGHELISAMKLSGLEINSQNYKVKIGPRFYALKRVGRPVSPPECNGKLVVSQRLLELGVLFPRITRNDYGEYYSSHSDGHVWILADFVEGEYFSGNRDHFYRLAGKIGELQRSLESLKPVNLPLSIAVGSWPVTQKILSELIERRTEWRSLFPQLEYDALVSSDGILSDAFWQVEEQIARFTDPPVPSRIDIHPHNILMNSASQPVFVDIDSLQVAGRIQCLAFATYKLARQYVVYEQLQGSPREISRTTREFVERLCHVANIGYEDYRKFPFGATVEILRRIALIADLNMHSQNREWNAVLHMQLDALREIPLLFEEISEIKGGL